MIKATLGFELTISKMMIYCVGQIDLTTQPHNQCFARAEKIYLNHVSKDGGSVPSLLLRKYCYCRRIMSSHSCFNSSVHLVPFSGKYTKKQP